MYAGQAALEGRTELDQFEIAVHVLHRKDDFNPVEDASVRKLVSQARQRLEEYYATEGLENAVEVALPNRSYVLRFRYRKDYSKSASEPHSGDAQEAGGALPATEPPASAGGEMRRQYRPYAIGAAIAATPFIVFFLLQAWSRTAQPSEVASHPSENSILIRTFRGDLRGKSNDVQPSAVLLGPTIGADEELSASVQFEPSGPTQQAGLMLFQDADNFVRLGWQFKLRNMVEFGLERQGDYVEQSATYRFDPILGRPDSSWFTLRKHGPQVRGFVSNDGFNWQPAGSLTDAFLTPSAVRAAIYGFDGRTQNRSATARFTSVGVGLSFHNRPEGDIDLSALAPDWNIHSGCPESVTTRIAQGALELGFRAEATNCGWELRKVAPPGDWTMSAVLDYMPVEGGSAGLVVHCERGKLNLSRRALSGGSILLEQSWDEDVGVPDFPGWPMINIKISFQRGKLSASFSRDGRLYTQIPGEVSVERMGKPVSVGVFTLIPKWSAAQNVSPARFYRIQQDLGTMQPFR